jgi:hypothetical protein
MMLMFAGVASGVLARRMDRLMQMQRLVTSARMRTNQQKAAEMELDAQRCLRNRIIARCATFRREVGKLK